MVNCLYDLAPVEDNREAYVNQRVIAAAPGSNELAEAVAPLVGRGPDVG